MFSFFKKQPEPKADAAVAKTFSNITKEQKYSIMNLLLFVSGGIDRNPQANELALLNVYCATFNVTPDQAHNYLERSGPQAIIQDLTTLASNQKDMLIIMVHEMIALRKPLSQSKIVEAMQFLDPIGID